MARTGLRATIWNEHVHERADAQVAAREGGRVEVERP
jgi:hypothetical protein